MERMPPRESAAAVPVDWRSQLLGSTSTTVGKATRQQGRASRGRCHVHFTGCLRLSHGVTGAAPRARRGVRA